MDSDDTISEANGRKLREVVLGGGQNGEMGYVVQVHCPGESEADRTVVDHVKLFRNRADLRFEGRIHEQILPSIRRAGGEVVFTDVFVTHSGATRRRKGGERSWSETSGSWNWTSPSGRTTRSFFSISA